MATSTWSTDDLRERDRFACWRDEHLWPLGIVGEPDSGAPGFHAAMSMTSRREGGAMLVRRVADGHRVFRGSREIGRRSWDGYSVHREAGRATWLLRAGREFVVKTGELVIADGDLPFEARTKDRYAHDVLLVPRAVLQPHLPAQARSLSLLLSNRPGVQSLAHGYFAHLVEQFDRIAEADLDQVLDAFCRLLAVAAGAEIGDHHQAVGAARLAAAKRHIDRHLADADLTAAGVAATLGISVRSLHLLFEPTGTSFARHVQRRRLEECRAALAGPAGARRSVTDIALGWGFNSLPTFYRAFRREFGLAPGELRR